MAVNAFDVAASTWVVRKACGWPMAEREWLAGWVVGHMQWHAISWEMTVATAAVVLCQSVDTLLLATLLVDASRCLSTLRTTQLDPIPLCPLQPLPTLGY